MLSPHQEELLETGWALDIELIGVPYEGEVWELYGFLDGKEYLWGTTGLYAGSIGFTEDGRYFAAPDDRFRKGIDKIMCVWYR